MGYTSDVVVAVKKEVYLEHIIVKGNKLPNLLKVDATEHNVDEMFLYEIESIKYYEDYPEVIELQKFMTELDELYGYDSYGFVRSGEDNGDIDTQGSPYNFDIYTETSIHTPVESI